MTPEEKRAAIVRITIQAAAESAKAMRDYPGWIGQAMAYGILMCARQNAFYVAAWTPSDGTGLIVTPNLGKAP